MTHARLMPALAMAATGFTAAGLALTALPSYAGTSHASISSRPQVAAQRPLVRARGAAPHLSSAQVTQVRARQQKMTASSKAPTFAKAGSKTFTVNTTEDSDLNNPAGTSCVDASTGKCSLRAAVDAANNLKKPVKIVLGKHTYTLSLATALTVTNPAGTSIVGQGSSKTTVKGSGSGVFYLTAATTSPGAILFLSDAKVTGGSTTYGGGFYLDDTSGAPELVLDHVVVSGNNATSDGGGLYASSYNSIYATDTKFTGNVSPTGAGMYTYWADLSFSNVTISGNHSPSGSAGSGGGIYNYYGVLKMKGGSISGNTVGDSTDGGGGGAISDTYGNVSLTGVHVDHNTANDGYAGAIYSYYDSIAVNGGTMSHNHANGADSTGGAIYQEYGSQIELHGVTMAGNKIAADAPAGDGGGAIYSYGYEYSTQLTIDSSKITGSNGSAIFGYVEYGQIDLSISHSTLSGNHNGANNGMSGYGCGGAVCLYGYYADGVNLAMTGNQVTDNTSVGDYAAGAVMVWGVEYGGASVNLKGNRFEKNVAGPNGYGGAVGFYDDDDYNPISVRSQSNKFIHNTAGTTGGAGWGGAMSLYYYATITDQGSTFSHNVAAGNSAYGGAVSSDTYQSARFVGTKFTDNRAGNKNGGEGYGGAVYSYAEGGNTLSKVTMSGNHAASYGGGLYSEDYGLSVDQSTFSGNTAGTAHSAGYGGGIYDSDAPMAIDNSTIAGNRALSISGSPGEGGGIFQDESPFDLRYSTVSGNVAKQGAGIYADYQGGNLVSSIVVGNKTATHGSEKDCTSDDVEARLHSLGGNVLGQGGCVIARQQSDKVTKHAGLKKLAHNGGPTETMALSAKSPALGRATFQVPSTDQRGHGRPSHHADAGAYELPKVTKHH
jgi:CSLREA domain-containing protein